MSADRLNATPVDRRSEMLYYYRAKKVAPEPGARIAGRQALLNAVDGRRTGFASEVLTLETILDSALRPERGSPPLQPADIAAIAGRRANRSATGRYFRVTRASPAATLPTCASRPTISGALLTASRCQRRMRPSSVAV